MSVKVYQSPVVEPVPHEWYFDGIFLVCRKLNAFTIDMDIDLCTEVKMTLNGLIPVCGFEKGMTCSEAVIKYIMNS